LQKVTKWLSLGFIRLRWENARIFRVYRQDFPGILLNKAVTPEIVDVQTWNGELRKSKKRLPELTRTFYEIESLDTSADTITLTESGVTAEFTSSDSVILYNSAGDTETHSVLSSADVSSRTVITVSTDITGSSPSERAFNPINVPVTDPTSQDFLKVQPPDGNEVIRAERFITADETERFVAFTKASVYFWDSTLTRYNLLFTSAGETDYWDCDEYGDYLVATNGVDRPQQWDGNSATTFSNIDTQYSASSSDFISTAKYIRAYRNYVILGNLVLSDASELQDSVVTSNIGEGVTAGGFRQDAGKDSGFYTVEGRGDISGGFSEWEGYLIIFKRSSTRKFWFVGGDIPFAQDNISEDVGCSAPGSVLKDRRGNLYFYASDRSIHEISQGSIDRGLNVSTRNFNPELNILIRSTFIEEYNEMWWAVPKDSESTANDLVIVFKEPGKWETIDLAVVTFGQYRQQQGYTWTTLPFATWSDWSWDTWTSVDANAEFPLDLSFDSSGYGYQVHGDYLDDGSSYNSSFVITTDMADKKGLPFKKRIGQMFVYVRNEGSGTLTIESKRDQGQTWENESGISGGTVNLFGPDDEGNTNDILRQRLSMDLDAFNYLFRVTGTTKFSVIGFEFEFELVGDR
jgi:hypothetical protein